MKVLLLSRYGRLGASSRIRSYQYLPRLESLGIDVAVAPLFSDEYVKALYAGGGRRLGEIVSACLRRVGPVLRAGAYDAVWIEYEIWPWLPALGEALLRLRGVPYLVDYDDAIFHRYDMHRARLVRALLGRKIDRVMRGAAAVIAGNDYLADRARAAGARRVEVIPSVVDLDRYAAAPAPARRPAVIGWMGTPVTARYVRGAERVLREACAGGRARVVLVGSGPVALDGVPVEVRPWTEESEAAEIQGMDIGIMPLADTPWERGKCGYKLIQYMACARPVVTSAVGANVRIVADGVTGFVARDDRAWLAALETLIGDADLRRRMGAAGRAAVEREYCVQVTAPRLAEIIRGLRR